MLAWRHLLWRIKVGLQPICKKVFGNGSQYVRQGANVLSKGPFRGVGRNTTKIEWGRLCLHKNAFIHGEIEGVALLQKSFRKWQYVRQDANVLSKGPFRGVGRNTTKIGWGCLCLHKDALIRGKIEGIAHLQKSFRKWEPVCPAGCDCTFEGEAIEPHRIVAGGKYSE